MRRLHQCVYCMRSIVEARFDPDIDNSDSGLVARAGAGAFQLRVGQPPGSQEPLVRRSTGVRVLMGYIKPCYTDKRRILKQP